MSGATPAVVLTIAGVDSAGGAGVAADLRTFAALGVHGACAVSVLTAQSTAAIRAVHQPPTEFLVAQVEAVVDDLRVAAVKTGMLASPGNVRAVAALAAAGRLPNLVVDPVLVSAHGALLYGSAADDVAAAYRDALIPRARVLTPNRLEAARLVGGEVRTLADMAAAGEELTRLGPEVVVVKGGDAEDEGDQSIDVVVYRNGRISWLGAPRVATGNDHGSGCSLAAAIAARLARGDALTDAIDTAKAFVHRALLGAAGWRLGAGHGPIDHLGWSRAD